MKQGYVPPSQAQPPLIQQCQIHQAALRPGLPLSLHPQCKCCHLPITKQPFTLCFSEIQTLYLGTGVALFFRFLLICLILVLLPLSAFSILSIITNLQQQTASGSFIYTLSNISSLSSRNQLHSYILAATIAISLTISPILIKLGLRILSRAYSDENQHFYPSALALLFKLEKPAGSLTQQQVIKTLNDWYETQFEINEKQDNLCLNVVQKVYFHFDLESYTVLAKQLEQLQKQKEMRFQYEDEISHPPENGQVDLKNYNSKRSYSSKYSQNPGRRKLTRMDQIQQKIANKDIEKTNKFIVVFKKLQYIELIKQKFNSGICSKHDNSMLIFPDDNGVQVADAPFPSEINYATQHFPKKHKLKGRLLSWCLTGVIVVVGTGVQYLILFLLNNYGILDGTSYGRVIAAAALYLIGEIALMLCILPISRQSQPSKTDEDRSSNLHLLITGVFLRCISIFAIFLFANGQFPSSIAFVETITWLVIIWSVLMLAGRLINLKTFKSCYARSVATSTIKKGKISQTEANRLFQKPQSQINLQYAQINIFVFSTFAFASITPIALFACLIYILLSLLIERVAFVYFESQPHPTNHQLYLLMSSLLWKLTIGLTLGHLYFILICQQVGFACTSQIKITYSILLGIGCLVLIIPTRMFRVPTNTELGYQKIKDRFMNTYQQFNGLYSLKFTVETQKSAIRQATKNEMLTQQLNTMSKSLETTLRDKIFNKKNPALEALNNREEDSLYFEFDNKVDMPRKKQVRQYSVPPIFKQNREDLLFKRNSKSKQNNLIKLTNLVKSEQETEIKNRIKSAIKDSINKIQ